MRVVYSPEAEAELVEIAGYIAQDSERQAEAFVARLRKKAEAISHMPRIYRRRDDLGLGLRSAVVGKHLIVFRIMDDGIEVSRVVHGARDLKRLFET
ncbi:MAG TPA: type II toxin-antitoxin system RelE/ParE family toxin [Rhizomicrobium sp.]